MLDLRRLAVFKAVADHTSFSAAAGALDYTQSVVSHHVAALEDELGLSLFERGRRPVRLTPAGQRLAAHAETVLGAAATAEADMRALAGLAAGSVRVGAFLSACASFVPPAVARFREAHPALDVRLHQLEPSASIPRLVAGELDVAVVFREQPDPVSPDPRLEHLRLAVDPYRVVLSHGHRLARRRTLRVGDLRGEPLSAPVAQGGGVAYRRMLERLCQAEGFEPDFAYTVDVVTVARAIAAAGLAIAVMPDMTIAQPRPDVVVLPLHGVDAFRTVEVAWVRERRAPGVAPMVAALRGAASARPGTPGAGPA